MRNIPQGRSLSLAPMDQPGNSLASSKASYKMAIRTGNQATANQQHRNGSRKFFDSDKDRTGIPTGGVALTPDLRKS